MSSDPTHVTKKKQVWNLRHYLNNVCVFRLQKPNSVYLLIILLLISIYKFKTHLFFCKLATTRISLLIIHHNIPCQLYDYKY